jgi:hypothetical protein
MAIVLNGSTIEIDTGIASGTATGGSANTLTGSGFGSWANRIVWITSGTGSGQSRFIRTATSTTLTVEPNWDVNPASGSTFSIGYTWADIDSALAGVTASSPNFYLVPYNLFLKAGGFIGATRESVRFTVSVPTMTSARGSLWQQGRLLNTGIGVDGGAVEFALTDNNNSNFYSSFLAGRVRWYGVAAAALPGGANYTLSTATTGGAAKDPSDLRDTKFNNIYVLLWTGDSAARVQTQNKPIWPAGATTPNLSDMTFVDNVIIINGDGGAGANTHYFGFTFDGVPRDPTFLKPYWVWSTTTKEGTYFWDTSAPSFANTFAATVFWAGTPSTAGFYTGRTVNVQTRQTNGSALASSLIGLWNNAGNAAWFEGINASDGTPINSLTITTDGSGNYANPHPAVAGQSGLVVAERLKAAGATQYGPWTVRARKYGYLEAGGVRNYMNNSTETLIMSLDAAITQTNGATVAAYTEIETSAKLYDRYQYHLSLAANIKTDNGLTRSGTLINAGAYNVTIDATAASVFSLVGNTITIKASTFTGDITTTGVITLANGAIFVGTRTDANGTVAPPKTVSITGLAAGSRLRIYNNTTATEVVNQVVAGTSYSATYLEGAGYTTGDTLTITATWVSGTSAKLPYSTQVVVGSSGWSALISQQDDTVYNTNGIDGSGITEFTPDYPNVQVDISDGDGSTSLNRLYAWFAYTCTTENGIRNWFGGLVAEDSANFKIVTSLLNLKLDNTASTGVVFTGDLRLYRDDGLAPVVASTTGGGSITLYAGKVYTVNVGGSALTGAESAKLMSLPSASDNATAVWNKTLP